MAQRPSATLTPRRGVLKPPTLPRSAQREIARGVRPVKGGDGGSAVDPAMLHDGSLVHDRDNARRYITCACVCETLLIPTADPCDVAHAQRDDSGKHYLPQLVRAGRGRVAVRAGLAGCPPRLYPPSQTVGVGAHRVSFDSMFDGLHERRTRLAREGADLHVRVGAVSTATTLALADASLAEGKRLRDVLHQQTRQRMTPRELALEREASALLGKTERTTNGRP